MSKSACMLMEREVRRHLESCFPGRDDLSMAIGVSGGADSMCLMHLLNGLGVHLHVVHINYKKRGTSADRDAQLVKDVTARKNIDCKIVTVDPHEAAGHNFQQWARELRYNALQLKADQAGADAIAVAHHQDDQIETILQKIFRGGGLASWSAMKVWDGRLFRPLLHISRSKIEACCREREIPYRDDETNYDSNFARNFLRNEWLPELEEHFPGWRTNVLRVAEQAEVFQSSLQFILRQISDDQDRLDRDRFLELDRNLQKSVIIHMAAKLDEDLDISRKALAEIAKLAALQTGKGVQLTNNLQLMRDRNHFKFVVDTGDADLFISLTKDKIEDQPVAVNGLEFRIQPYADPEFGTVLFLDVDAIDWPLQLRRWRSGDRFQPLGMQGHQQVADHLTNRKVSAAEKQNALVLETFEETICAVIFPPTENRVPPGTISDRAKCTSSTRRCLTITRLP